MCHVFAHGITNMLYFNSFLVLMDTSQLLVQLVTNTSRQIKKFILYFNVLIFCSKDEFTTT